MTRMTQNDDVDKRNGRTDSRPGLSQTLNAIHKPFCLAEKSKGIKNSEDGTVTTTYDVGKITLTERKFLETK